MIVEDIENKEKIIKIFPVLKDAFDFIDNIKGDILKFKDEKRYDINGNMYAVVGLSAPKALFEQKLEVHEKYTDLQYIIDGYEIIGWKNRQDCKKLYKEYDKTKDIAFYGDLPDFDITLKKGKFALFFPTDAHSPLKGNKEVLKCIVKIKTESL